MAACDQWEQWDTKQWSEWRNEIRKLNRDPGFFSVSENYNLKVCFVLRPNVWWHLVTRSNHRVWRGRGRRGILIWYTPYWGQRVIDPPLSSPDLWTCVRHCDKIPPASHLDMWWGVMRLKSMCNEHRNWFTHWHMTHMTQCYRTLNKEQVHRGKHTMLPCLTI